MAEAKILVVDDEPVICDLIEESLSEFDHEITKAHNVDRALLE